MSAAAPAQPCTRPTTNWTPVDNAFLEQWSMEAGVGMAIQMFLYRNTVGWGRIWFFDTVAGLAKKLMRSKSQVRECLDELVAAGAVIMSERGRGRYALALVKKGPQAKPNRPTPDGGKPSCATVENSESGNRNSVPESGPPDSENRRAGLPESGGPDSDLDLSSCNNSETAIPKQILTENRFSKENHLLEPISNPATTVENSPEEGSKSPRNRTVLVEHESSCSKALSGSTRHPRLLDKPSLENHASVRVKKLKGFPTREEVPISQRMAYERFEKHWEGNMGKDRDHALLRSYVWHTFTAGDAWYLIHECRRAWRLYPYANRVVRAMMKEDQSGHGKR